MLSGSNTVGVQSAFFCCDDDAGAKFCDCTSRSALSSPSIMFANAQSLSRTSTVATPNHALCGRTLRAHVTGDVQRASALRVACRACGACVLTYGVVGTGHRDLYR